MQAQGDIVTDNNGNLQFTSGDVMLVDATHYHTRDILQSEPGEYKETPLIGVGIQSFTHEENVQELKSTIRRELQRDGQRVDTVKIDDKGDILINSWYE